MQAVRFTAGFLVGLLGVPLLAAVALAALVGLLLVREGGSAPASRDTDAAFLTRGADVSRAGGATVLIKQDYGAVTRQTCRDACDDLSYSSKVLERVEVRDREGHCIFCNAQGLRLPFQPSKERALEGAPLHLHERAPR